MHRPSRHMHFLLIGFILPLSPIAHAQVSTGSITGSVQDPSGASIVGAIIRVTNTETAATQSGTSSSAGNYQFLLLPPGIYTLSVSSPGFKEFRREGLVVEGDRSLAVPVSLVIGSASETVEVSAGTVLLDAATSELGAVVNNNKIVNLPMNGRNPLFLANLTPTVKGVGLFGQDVVGSWTEAAVSIGGGNALSNAYMVDGLSNNKLGDSGGALSFLEVSNTEEFKVITNAMAAEYGQTGGGIISVISKSGTNQYRGDAIEYFRNSALNANDFFSNRAGAPVPPLRINQYGASVGGPIRKDRLFFFANFDSTISRVGSSSLFTSPTPLQRAGDYSQTLGSNGQLITIFDPTTTTTAGIRLPFSGNVIPPSRISQASQVLLGQFPQGNQAGLPYTNANNLYTAASQNTNRFVEGGKVDYILTPTQRLAVRLANEKYSLTKVRYLPGLLNSDGRQASIPRQTVSLQYTNSLTPQWLLDAKVAFVRDGEQSISPSALPPYNGYDVTKLGFPASLNSQIQQASFAPGVLFPSFVITDLTTLGSNQGIQLRHGITWSSSFAATRVFSSHTMKFGYQRNFYEFFNQTVSSPSFSFTRGFTQGPNANTSSANSGYGVASLQLGYPSSGTISYAPSQIYGLHYQALFVQDDWKLTHRLTLNLGLRWDYNSPITDRFNILSNFDPNLAFPLQVPGVSLKGGLTFPGVGGNPRGLTDPNYRHYGPRFGFAYTASDKIVVRGGYGIIYTPMQGATYGATGFSSSTAMVTSLNGGLTPSNTLSNPFPNGVLLPTNSSLGPLTGIGSGISGQLRNTDLGYVQQWNLTVQYQPIRDWLVEVAYLGNHGVHLLSLSTNLNQLAPQYLALGNALNQQVPNPFLGLVATGPLSATTVTQQQLLLPYPQFTGVTSSYGSLGNNIYHALSLRVEKKFSHGVSLSSSYVFSKQIDAVDLNTSGRTSATADTGVVNWYNLKAERSISANNVPNRLVSSVVWELPFLKSSTGLVHQAFGGWQINVISTIESGRPIALSASSGGRPNVVAGVSPALSDPGIAKWFNTAAYSIPAAFTYGNSSRTIPNVLSDGIFNFDTSLFKNFAMTERFKLEVRAEAFNLLNTVTFDTPNTSINSTSFGVVSAESITPGPRKMQLALRLRF